MTSNVGKRVNNLARNLIYKHSRIPTKRCIEKQAINSREKSTSFASMAETWTWSTYPPSFVRFVCCECWHKYLPLSPWNTTLMILQLEFSHTFHFSTEFFPLSCWVLTGLANSNFSRTLLISIYSKFVARRRALSKLDFMIDIESQTTLEFISQMIIRCLHTFSNSLVVTSECQLSRNDG